MTNRRCILALTRRKSSGIIFCYISAISSGGCIKVNVTIGKFIYNLPDAYLRRRSFSSSGEVLLHFPGILFTRGILDSLQRFLYILDRNRI